MAKKGEYKYAQLNDREWLYQKYWTEDLSTLKIAEIVGCHFSTVSRALERKGIQIRTLSEALKGLTPSQKTKDKMSAAHTKLTHIQRKLNQSFSTRMSEILKGKKRGRHWETLVGYTLAELMQTLEREFREGMSWENYGKVWQVDHIIPLAHFDYNSPDDLKFRKAWALGNLQPLWKGENQRKGTKFMFF
jgi:5-methylcytosine-specific restriction endonuclease McrA